MQEEIWKDIPEYEGYYRVSNLGRVKSVEREVTNGKSVRVVKERILVQKIGTHNYLSVNLWKQNKGRMRVVHQLMAMAFLNHIPNRFAIVVDHINGIKTDNRLENLQLISHRENSTKNRNGKASKYVGVSWISKRKRWKVGIQINKKSIYLGTFKDEYEAHLAYEAALQKIKNNEL